MPILNGREFPIPSLSFMAYEKIIGMGQEYKINPVIRDSMEWIFKKKEDMILSFLSYMEKISGHADLPPIIFGDLAHFWATKEGIIREINVDVYIYPNIWFDEHCLQILYYDDIVIMPIKVSWSRHKSCNIFRCIVWHKETMIYMFVNIYNWPARFFHRVKPFFDIESVYFCKGKIEFSVKELDPLDIINNIKNRKFRILHHCCIKKISKEFLIRFEKLISTGWKPQSLPICLEKTCLFYGDFWRNVILYYFAKKEKKIENEFIQKKYSNTEIEFPIKKNPEHYELISDFKYIGDIAYQNQLLYSKIDKREGERRQSIYRKRREKSRIQFKSKTFTEIDFSVS